MGVWVRDVSCDVGVYLMEVNDIVKKKVIAYFVLLQIAPCQWPEEEEKRRMKKKGKTNNKK